MRIERVHVVGAALAAAAWGCVPAQGVPADEDRDTGWEIPEDGCVVTSCTSGIRSPTMPAAGATGVHPRTPFVVPFLADEEGTARFRLVRDRDGAEVPLAAPRWSPNGKDASFRALATLEPLAAHTLQVWHACSCGEPVPVRFTTSAVGEAVGIGALGSRSFALDLGAATFVQPPGVQSLLASLFRPLEGALVLQPRPVDGALAWRVGWAHAGAEGWTQDVCAPTRELPAAPFPDDPWFVGEAPDGLVLSMDGLGVRLRHLELTGAFLPDAAGLEGVELRAELDTRDLIPLFGDELGEAPGDDALCTLLAQFTSGLVACGACADDGEDRCLAVELVNVAGAATDPFVLQARTEEEAAAACDPAAEASRAGR